MGAASSVPASDVATPDGSPDAEAKTTRTTRSHLIFLSRSHNKFAINLFLEFARDGKRPGNFVLFPLGISIGLGMLYLGAKGNCRDEMYKAMDLRDVEADHLLPGYAAIHWDILRSSTPKGCSFEVAIAPFAPNEVYMSHEYEDNCNQYELTQIINVDFLNRHDRARKEINDWAEQRTHGRIKDVIPMGVVDRDSNMVLLVALYLKVHWLRPFPLASTSSMPFFLPMKETPNVHMMYQQGNFRWASFSKLDCDVLELPFSNTHTKMLIFLPKKQDGMNKIETKLSRTHFELVQNQLTEETVDVYLPKFRYELGHTTADKLQSLGIKDLMTQGKAQLPGFEGKQNVFLSRCFHHIYFEFDEGQSSEKGGNSGSGASTSNASSGGDNETYKLYGGDPKKIKTFKCDHPFLIVVKDDRTHAIMLLGRVVRPMIV